MRIVYMGTPDFAVEALEVLAASHEVVAVVSQPDKPKGRKMELAMPPVKETAMKYNIPVYQPVKVKNNTEFLETLKGINPDVIVVVAFGQLLPKEILELPKYRCINIHASLLPKYRGAAPIQWAVIDGEEETGVTTMLMDEGLDTGDILEQKTIRLAEDETGGSLFDKLAKLGGELILSTLEGLENNTITPVSQRQESSNYAKMLTKELGNLDFLMDAASLERLIRGLNPWPSAYTHWNGKTLKIWKAMVVESECMSENSIGTVVHVSKDSFVIQTKECGLCVQELQLEGKKRMDCGTFLRGYHLEVGDRFAFDK